MYYKLSAGFDMGQFLKGTYIRILVVVFLFKSFNINVFINMFGTKEPARMLCVQLQGEEW
jgi:hypothetical protein